MSEDLRIGVAGLGTVGAGVVKLLETNREPLRQKCGRGLRVVAVCARDRAADRGFDPGGLRWFDDPRDLATAQGIDVVAELIGGEDGPAKALAEAAIAHGKALVTANKALIAHHGNALAAAAEAKGVALAFEAAVAGGIPIVKALRDSLAGNRLARVYGILNGTCNFILTKMEETGAGFAEVLAEAQDLGYAEADPAFDIDGIDTAHKLAILAGVAFGRAVDFGGVHVEGIRRVTAEDIKFARELGYRIKLLGLAGRTGRGIEQRVHPCMVPISSPVAGVGGAVNAVVADGDFVGRTVFEGMGAGAGPTASAVVGDLVDIARGQRTPPFGVATAQLEAIPAADMAHHVGAYYVRLRVVDRPGVMADIAAILRDHAVSIESVLQRGRDPDEAVSLIMTMHNTQEAGMLASLAGLEKLPTVCEPPCMIRIEHV